MASADASATSTITNGDRESDYNEQVEHQLYPGPEEQLKHPYLVEFDPDDPLNPKACVLPVLSDLMLT